MSSSDAYVAVFVNRESDTRIRVGQPALFWMPDVRLLEEPTEFLHKRYVRSGRRASPHTWQKAAHALQSWFDYLHAIGVDDWQQVSIDDLIDYRTAYSNGVSPKTFETYSSGTIGDRMRVIAEFYEWCRRDLGAPSEVAHAIPARRQKKTAIRPFTVSELRAFLSETATQTGSIKSNDMNRDRLIFDLGWAVGLRLNEINGLTVYPFLAMTPDPKAPVSEQRLHVTGKFSQERPVAIPNWLCQNVIYYIMGERKACVSAARLFSRKEPARLFLSGTESNEPGKPISNRRIQQIVEETCIRAGLVIKFDATCPDTGVCYVRHRARHCVHDLRHTYAVLTYWAEKKAGNSEPWKKIQAQLGHANLQTTIDTYLSFVEIFGEKDGLVDVRRLIDL